MGDDRGVGQRADRASQMGRNIGMTFGETADIQFIDQAAWRE